MKLEYKPNLREIVKEIGSDVKKFFDNTPTMLKATYGTAKIFGKATGGVIVGPYIIPSIVQAFRKIDSEIKPIKQHEVIVGQALGVMPGSLVIFSQMHLYSDLIRKGHPEVLLVPVATNILSGIYEWGRSAQRRLVKKHKDLEDKTIGVE